jgi:hypothetical protein
LEFLAMESNASVVFAHHCSKGPQAKIALDRASGSGGFARIPDTLFTMSENEENGPNGEKAFTVELDFRSFPPMMPFGVRHSFPIFRLDDSIDPAKIVGKKKSSKYTDEVFKAKRADARCCSPTCRSRLHRASIGRLRTLKELIRAEERKLRAELFED